jgi:hypothetical protein
MIHHTQFINQDSRGTVVIPAGTIQLGTPGTQAESLGKAPFSYAYDYSWSTWIVKASELAAIGGAVTINSIELYVGYNSGATQWNTQRIWCSHTDKDSWSGDLPNVDFSGYSSISDRTQLKVFDQNFPDDGTPAGYWIEFDFTTNEFEWDGTSNLAFEWLNKDGSYDFSGPKFDIQSVAGSVAYKRQDSSYPSGASALDAERPIMKINYNQE